MENSNKRNSVLSESEIKDLDLSSIDDGFRTEKQNVGGTKRSSYVPPPPAFYRYAPPPENFQEAMEEVDFLRKRLVRRMEIIEALRRAYLKDVVAVRIEHLRLVDAHNHQVKQWTRARAPAAAPALAPAAEAGGMGLAASTYPPMAAAAAAAEGAEGRPPTAPAAAAAAGPAGGGPPLPPADQQGGEGPAGPGYLRQLSTHTGFYSGELTAMEAAAAEGSFGIEGGGLLTVSEQVHHNVPSLDFRSYIQGADGWGPEAAPAGGGGGGHGEDLAAAVGAGFPLPLHAPAESFLVCKPCPACGGHLEVIKHESKKIKKLKKEVQELQETEKQMRLTEKKLKREIISLETKLSQSEGKGKVDQEIMNKTVLKLKAELKQKVDKSEVDKLEARVQAEKRKYGYLEKDLQIIPELRGVVAAKEKEVAKLEASLHHEKLRHAETAQEKVGRETELGEARAEIAALEKRLEDRRAELEAEGAAKASVEAALTEARARVAKLETRIQRESAEQSDNKVALMNLEAELREQLEAEEARNETLGEKIDELKSEVRKLAKENSTMKAKLEDAQRNASVQSSSAAQNALEEMFAMEAADEGDQSMLPPGLAGAVGGSPSRRKRDQKQKDPQRGDERADMSKIIQDAAKSGSKDVEKKERRKSSHHRKGGGRRVRSRASTAALSAVAALGRGGASAAGSAAGSAMNTARERDEDIEALKREVAKASEDVDNDLRQEGAEVAPRSVKVQLRKMKLLVRAYDRRVAVEQQGQDGLKARLDQMELEMQKRQRETQKLLTLIDPDVLEKNRTFIMDYGFRASEGSNDTTGTSGMAFPKMALNLQAPVGDPGAAVNAASAGASKFKVANTLEKGLTEDQIQALQAGESLYTAKNINDQLQEKEDFLRAEFEDRCEEFREEIKILDEEKKAAEAEVREMRVKMAELEQELTDTKLETEALAKKLEGENKGTNLAAQKMANDVGTLRMEFEVATIALEKSRKDQEELQEKVKKAEKYAKKLKKELKAEKEKEEGALKHGLERARAAATMLIQLSRSAALIHAACAHARRPTSDKNRTVEVIKVDKIMRTVRHGEEDANASAAKLDDVITMLGEQPVASLVEYAEEMSAQTEAHVLAEVNALITGAQKDEDKMRKEFEETSKQFESKIAKLDKAIADKIKEMESYKKNALAEAATLREKMEMFKKQNADLENAASASATQLLMVEELKKKTMANKKELFQKTNKIAELEKNLATLTSEHNETEEDLNRTQQELERTAADRDRLTGELAAARGEAADFRARHASTGAQLTDLIEAERHRLATNVSVACEVKPNHFTIDKQIQTEFVTPEMTLRQVNHFQTYPSKGAGGAPFVKPMVKNAEPPLWALRSEFNATKPGYTSSLDRGARPWTDGSMLGSMINRRNPNQESAVSHFFNDNTMSNWQSVPSSKQQKRPYTQGAAYPLVDSNHRNKLFPVQGCTMQIPGKKPIRHSESASSLLGDRSTATDVRLSEADGHAERHGSHDLRVGSSILPSL